MATRTIPLNANKFEFMQTLYCTSENVPVAYAEQVQDRVTGEMQETVNEGFRDNFEALTLTDADLDAIVNGVDNEGKYIDFTLNSVATRAYRHAGDNNDNDGTSTGYKHLCFSTTAGVKYYVKVASDWSEQSGTIAIGSDVYSDKACTTDTGVDVSGGKTGFVVAAS